MEEDDRITISKVLMKFVALFFSVSELFLYNVHEAHRYKQCKKLYKSNSKHQIYCIQKIIWLLLAKRNPILFIHALLDIKDFLYIVLPTHSSKIDLHSTFKFRPNGALPNKTKCLHKCDWPQKVASSLINNQFRNMKLAHQSFLLVHLIKRCI